ncbi:carbamoyl-phosphate synthase [Aureococcus anophagefferens]|nr:carbamoyl-phosphate synthase [Aureococcus anophagefferens]
MPGEVVFNTGMVGYPEALTDPSYRGQILVLTYPLVGNYGVPSFDKIDAFGLPTYFESKDVQIAGLVVSSYSEDPSHWASTRSLGSWLEEAGVPAIFGVDTRMLTKSLRERGAMLGRLEVSTKTIVTYGVAGGPKIVAIDCGMKFNIIRYLVEAHGVELTVVPHDYDLETNPSKLEWDGVFCSNGPGDPSKCAATIKSLKWAISQEKPVFGICLGNQILALAAGGTTYKMKYGNRGMNQPCVDLRTTRCYITSQNHGFAVDDSTLPDGWRALFINANDRSNEGITHTSKPFFSVQFHPEAAGGPFDTAFLFESFVRLVRGNAPQLTLLDPNIYRHDRASLKRVLLVGSGGLSIGQAGEFDYSGSQAIKALREEGIEVVLINPNIATVQTSREDDSNGQLANVNQAAQSKVANVACADRVYLLPVTAANVRMILDKESDIDGIIVSMGGQTALNVGIELWANEDLQKRDIRILIDQDLRGWKEVEYEVVRDVRDNCITVCNMENFDPLGVHTGDSIVVAPSQTLSRTASHGLPPLAYVATKLSLGQDLVSIRNSVTGTTTACFEPSLDYCVVKMPRWDMRKFSRVSTKLGSAMKSVGEVMAIGRSFEEALQKAVRMVRPGSRGLEGEHEAEYDASLVSENLTPDERLSKRLKVPTDQRLFAVQAAFEQGIGLDKVHELTRIDRWFLTKMRRIARLRSAMEGLGDVQALNLPSLRKIKQAGFSDGQIGHYTKCVESRVRRHRLSLGLKPVVKQIDTLGAEFPAVTNYLYMTYHGEENDVVPKDRGVMVLGCGAYCIGSSVEFDWSAVSCVRQVRASGYRAIVVNYNPETVSTDYDEAAWGLVVSVGGQIPQNLAMPLHDNGVRVLGTSPTDIDRAEDRHKFSAMLDDLGVDQPAWRELQSVADAKAFAEEFLGDASAVSPDRPVVVSKFIRNAKEIEFDAVCKEGHVLNYAISEHVENAGVHSGDATLVLPAQKLYVQTQKQVKRIAARIAKALNISGPVNIQLMARENDVKVIECNLRASRSFPFLSKTLNANFISLATRVMLGVPARPYQISLMDIDYVAVKAAMFSFTRLRGADPIMGVEMASTGEVACLGADVYEAYLLALEGAGTKIPTKAHAAAGKQVFLSISNASDFAPHAAMLAELGFKLLASPGTAKAFNAMKVPCETVAGGAEWAEAACEALKDGDVVFCINVPSSNKLNDVTEDGSAETNGYKLRTGAISFGVGLLTNEKCANLFVESLYRHLNRDAPLPVRHLDEFYAGDF